MRRQLLDVEEPQAVRGEDLSRGEQREVREVLVVDRVELRLLDQAQQVRELHRDAPPGVEQELEAGDEVVEVRHVGEHVVADDQVGRRALVGEPRAELRAEERDQRRDAVRLGDRGHVRGRLDAEHRHAALDEPLQQVAVVAGDLDDASCSAPRPKRADRLLDVARARARPSSSSRTRSRRSRRRSPRGDSNSSSWTRKQSLADEACSGKKGSP